MIILCDTSSIFFLLRIVPDMFIDPKYECITLPEIYNEVFRTQKFKNKYPWRINYKSKVKPLPFSHYKTPIFIEMHRSIQLLLGTGIVDSRTGELFNLSPEDCVLATCALANNYELSSGDSGLVVFAKQEFPDFFKGNLSALEVINRWLVSEVMT